jgi:hypothetical protein
MDIVRGEVITQPGTCRYCLDVGIAAPHPKKWVSSVQIGHPGASAAARIGQSSGSRASRCPCRLHSQDLPTTSARPTPSPDHRSVSPPIRPSVLRLPGMQFQEGRRQHSLRRIRLCSRTRWPSTARMRVLASRVGVEFFCGGAHRFDFRLAASLLRGYKEA